MRFPLAPWSFVLTAAWLLAFDSSAADSPPASAPPPRTVTDGTLSYLEPTAEEKCRWVQHTPTHEPRTVLLLPTACDSVRLAWSADGSEGLIHLSTGTDESAKEQLSRVELATGKQTRLPIPSLGKLERHGFDSQGRPLALMEDDIETLEDGTLAPPKDGSRPHLELVAQGSGRDKKQVILFQGQRYPMSEEGTPGLAHAFRLEKGGWKRGETHETSYDIELAQGVRVLKAYADLGPSPERMEEEARAAFEPVPAQAPVLKQLPLLKASRGSAGQGPREWRQCKTSEGMLYAVWGGEAESAFLQAPVFFQGGSDPVELEVPDIVNGNGLTLFHRGPLLLLRGARGDKPVARLWNLKTQRLAASLDGKEQLTFWPQPSAPPPRR